MLKNAKRNNVKQQTDTFPVGCRFSEKIVYPEFFKSNPDYYNPAYNSLYGIYKANCGLDNVFMSFGHDEYMYMVAEVFEHVVYE